MAQGDSQTTFLLLNQTNEPSGNVPQTSPARHVRLWERMYPLSSSGVYFSMDDAMVK
jgi:hypothetical protein